MGTCCEMADSPDIEAAPDRSVLDMDDMGRRSGNNALTRVDKSDGLSTRYGWTSRVSLREVMDLAGSSLADGVLEREPWNLARMLST